MNCPACGRFMRKARRGPQPKRCVPCRRAEELAVKRIQRRLQALEAELLRLETQTPQTDDRVAYWYDGCRGRKTHIDHLRRQIEREEKRLRELFDESNEPSKAKTR